MTQTNLFRLKVIAEGLGELNQQVVFVGGSVAELYADNPAATEIRMTEDVDCVIELATYRGLSVLEEALRKKGFSNDMTPGAPICRWTYKNEVVDIMPDDKNVLGFTNQWYKPAFVNRITISLAGGVSIFILPATYYIATKIEAIKDRGGNDWRSSHDFEDLIYVLNNNKTFLELYDSEENIELKSYLSNWAKETLARQNIREEIECALPYGESERSEYINEILYHLANEE